MPWFKRKSACAIAHSTNGDTQVDFAAKAQGLQQREAAIIAREEHIAVREEKVSAREQMVAERERILAETERSYKLGTISVAACSPKDSDPSEDTQGSSNSLTLVNSWTEDTDEPSERAIDTAKSTGHPEASCPVQQHNITQAAKSEAYVVRPSEKQHVDPPYIPRLRHIRSHGSEIELPHRSRQQGQVDSSRGRREKVRLEHTQPRVIAHQRKPDASYGWLLGKGGRQARPVGGSHLPPRPADEGPKGSIWRSPSPEWPRDKVRRRNKAGGGE